MALSATNESVSTVARCLFGYNAVLDAYFPGKAGPMRVTLHLYFQRTTPDRTTNTASLVATESNLTGYAARPLTPSLWSTPAFSSGIGSMAYPAQTFSLYAPTTGPANAATNYVQGVFYTVSRSVFTNPANPQSGIGSPIVTALFFQDFGDNAILIPPGGGSITFTPQIAVGFDAATLLTYGNAPNSTYPGFLFSASGFLSAITGKTPLVYGSSLFKVRWYINDPLTGVSFPGGVPTSLPLTELSSDYSPGSWGADINAPGRLGTITDGFGNTIATASDIGQSWFNLPASTTAYGGQFLTDPSGNQVAVMPFANGEAMGSTPAELEFTPRCLVR